MTRSALRSAIAAATIVLVLAGCTPSGGSAKPSASATATPHASATHASSPSATSATTTTTTTSTTTTTTAAGACPTWNDASAAGGLAQIDFNRFAGICVGMDFPSASAASGEDIAGIAQCPWDATIIADDTAGFYVSALSPVQSPGSAVTFFRMAWNNDPATASSYEMPTTAEGIRIGSTLAQLQAAYPSATHYAIDDMSRGPRDEWVVLGPGGNNYIFDVTAGLVSELNWGHVQSTGIQGEYCAL
jgi:hypothetical protein